MDAHIKEINEKVTKARKTLEKYTNALEALQDICEHKWNYEGHGHNSNFYTCSKCGATKDD